MHSLTQIKKLYIYKIINTYVTVYTFIYKYMSVYIYVYSSLCQTCQRLQVSHPSNLSLYTFSFTQGHTK